MVLLTSTMQEETGNPPPISHLSVSPQLSLDFVGSTLISPSRLTIICPETQASDVSLSGLHAKRSHRTTFSPCVRVHRRATPLIWPLHAFWLSLSWPRSPTTACSQRVQQRWRLFCGTPSCSACVHLYAHQPLLFVFLPWDHGLSKAGFNCFLFVSPGSRTCLTCVNTQVMLGGWVVRWVSVLMGG